MKAECPFDSIVFCSLIQQWTRLESKTTTMEPKSRQEGMLKSPVLSLWLPWSYFSRLLRSCIGTVGLFLLPRPHRAHYILLYSILHIVLDFDSLKKSRRNIFKKKIN